MRQGINRSNISSPYQEPKDVNLRAFRRENFLAINADSAVSIFGIPETFIGIWMAAQEATNIMTGKRAFPHLGVLAYEIPGSRVILRMFQFVRQQRISRKNTAGLRYSKEKLFS